MKKPIKPNPPHKPTPPKEFYDSFERFDYYGEARIFSLEEIKENLEKRANESINYSDIKCEIFYESFNIWVDVNRGKHKNPYYEKGLKNYEKKLLMYKQKMEDYKTKKESYDLEMASYNEHLKQEEIKVAQKILKKHGVQHG